jgi:2-oxoglutarate dehydrogenase complex dehydrogenase (E1) component-like enzyme
MQYTKSFPPENPITEFENETTPLDLANNETHQLKPPPLSSQREPLHFMNTYDDQNISKREWHQNKLKRITNMSNLDQFINKLWQEVHVATSHLTAEDKEDTITTLQSKIESLPNDNTRIDAEELEELRDLGVGIPQRMNRAETVRKAIQRHIDKLESS